MAAIYKALSKSDSKKDIPKTNGVAKENRQRVLMLTSRGVTFR
jgi:ribosome biogenesis protein BRX1